LNDFSLTPAEAECALRAMHSVATVSGLTIPLPIERELLLSVRGHVLRSAVDVDALSVISPAELRAVLRDPDQRGRVVRCVVLVPYVSLEVDAAKIATVDAFAMQLGTSPEVLRDLHLRREAQLERVALDQARRGAHIYLTVRTSARLRGIVDALRRQRRDDALAARYQALAGLAPGTLGRALFDFHRGNGFPLPGEVGALAEVLVSHDLLRVLGGFSTDPASETALVGFAAGLARLPMGRQLVLDALVEMHASAQLAGALASTTGRPRFEPAALTAAYDRGVVASAALVRGWNWWSDAAEDVGVLRARYGLRVPRPGRPASSPAVPAAAVRAKQPEAA